MKNQKKKKEKKKLNEIKVDVLGESDRNNFPNSFIELPSVNIYSYSHTKISYIIWPYI